MNYQKQIDTFVRYFKEAESKKEHHKIGLEFEHLVLNEDLTAVKYSGEQRIESLLEQLAQNSWEKVYENNNLIGLQDRQRAVTLEPGGQLELSLVPFASLEQIESLYLDFVEELTEILNRRNQKLAVLGYQPVSSIKEIPLLPKKRYDFMYRYFKKTGRYAHNMMKGTASVQINIDYINEKDYIKKLRLSYFLTPMIYYLFDNTPFFEGETATNQSIREKIWSNCDSDRSGIIAEVFEKEFGYSDYAEYVLNTPAIINKKQKNLIYSGCRKIKELMENDKKENIEHFLSMVFPDVRTKQYIEIRSADALPYPYNFAFAVLLKGIFYNQNNLDHLYQQSLKYSKQQFLEFKEEVIRAENSRKRDNLIETVFKLVENNSNPYEKKHLLKLKDLYLEYKKPKLKTIKNLEQGKKAALNWCLLN